ncbi:hypothetical protein F5Y00DRAFT_103887 [Daldinia vernicosa]|uniref:uncharacterized protein n=1 Tax=Daldinia vernicosa TaxID=114800 RepID=UPI00200747F4|nr:uncharacterized protein F5Y00DRAFT_103887 [Daldinia vernicosa]KAI0853554.1 hypothetical protein F5Y00DRAFT_103887 [Daldinia vernicosa]
MSSHENQTSTPTSNASLPMHPKPKREGESPVSEQSDQDITETESPADEIVADYDVKLGKEEREAIDTSNIISERTRHAKPINGSYILPDEEEEEEEEDDDGDVLLREDGTVVSADADVNAETGD